MTASVGPAARRLRASISMEKREPCQRFTSPSVMPEENSTTPWRLAPAKHGKLEFGRLFTHNSCIDIHFVAGRPRRKETSK
jgi:hypothetical protein